MVGTAHNVLLKLQINKYIKYYTEYRRKYLPTNVGLNMMIKNTVGMQKKYNNTKQVITTNYNYNY